MKPNWNWTIRVDTLYSNSICYDLWKHTQTHTYASDKFFYQISTDTPFSNVYKMYWMSEYTDGGRQKLLACKIYGIFFTAIGMTISLRSVFWMESVLRNVCIVYIHIHSTYIAHIYMRNLCTEYITHSLFHFASSFTPINWIVFAPKMTFHPAHTHKRTSTSTFKKLYVSRYHRMLL